MFRGASRPQTRTRQSSRGTGRGAGSPGVGLMHARRCPGRVPDTEPHTFRGRACPLGTGQVTSISPGTWQVFNCLSPFLLASKGPFGKGAFPSPHTRTSARSLPLCAALRCAGRAGESAFALTGWVAVDTLFTVSWVLRYEAGSSVLVPAQLHQGSGLAPAACESWRMWTAAPFTRPSSRLIRVVLKHVRALGHLVKMFEQSSEAGGTAPRV